MKENYCNYFKNLPEGSTISFVDQNHNPVDVYITELGPTSNDGKDVEVILEFNIPEDRMIVLYDLKILSGLEFFARHWKEYRESFFQFACENSDDDRWEDEGFRKHMYNQYINVERPITDQLYNLDRSNLKTLFKYIDKELMRGTAHNLVDSGLLIKKVTPVDIG